MSLVLVSMVEGRGPGPRLLSCTGRGGASSHGENGSIKRLRVGEEAAEANLRELLKDVYAQAGVGKVYCCFVGVASCSLPGDRSGSRQF